MSISRPRTQVSALLLTLVLLGTTAQAQTSFRPRQVWLDESGNPIQSHLGGMLFEKGVYYWYGMDFRGKTLPPGTLPGMGCTWAYSKGVTIYSSRDLLHWKAGQNQLTPDTPNAGGLLAPLNSVVRPKVIKNDATGTFIMMVALTALLSRYSGDPTFQFAGLVLASIPAILVYAIFQRYIIKGISLGSTK